MIGFIAGRLVAGEVHQLLSQLRRALSTREQRNLDDLEQRQHVTELGQKLYRTQLDLMARRRPRHCRDSNPPSFQTTRTPPSRATSI
jgi:hypothetical protein